MKTAILSTAQIKRDRPSVTGHSDRIGQADSARCDIRWSDGVLHIRVFDGGERSALLETAQSLSADPRFNALQVLMADFLDVAEQEGCLLGLLEDFLGVLLDASFTNPHVRIIVLAPDPYIVELADAMVRFGREEFPPIRAFDSRDEAADWMELQPRA